MTPVYITSSLRGNIYRICGYIGPFMHHILKTIGLIYYDKIQTAFISKGCIFQCWFNILCFLLIKTCVHISISNTGRWNKVVEVTLVKDTIWAMHVVRIARTDKIEPRALSCRSVTVAIPTPISRIERESWILLLQQWQGLKEVLAQCFNQYISWLKKRDACCQRNITA